MLAANLSMAEQCTISASPKSLHHAKKGHQQAATVTVKSAMVLKLPQQQVATAGMSAANLCMAEHGDIICLYLDESYELQ